KRLLLLERHRDPVGLAAHEIVRIVGARRAAENDRAGVLREGFREWIAEAWVAHVERIAALLQRMANAPGCGVVAVQNEEDWFMRLGHGLFEHDLFRKPVSTFRDHALSRLLKSLPG